MAMSVWLFRREQCNEGPLSLSNSLGNTSVYSLFEHFKFPLIKNPDNVNGNFIYKAMIN